jgi:hypothetical protein
LYAGLAAWCTCRPHRAAEQVGFQLRPGAGESEFVTVYGGLELGLAAIFLLPLVRPATTAASLHACLLVHACLVVFRTGSFLRYGDMPRMTYQLAAGEWAILAGAAAATWFARRGAAGVER